MARIGGVKWGLAAGLCLAVLAGCETYENTEEAYETAPSVAMEAPMPAAREMVPPPPPPMAAAPAFESIGDVGGFIPSVFFDGNAASPCNRENQLRASGEEADSGYTCLELFFGTNRALRESAPTMLGDYEAYPPDPDSFFTDERLPLEKPDELFLRDRRIEERHADYETYATGRAFVTVPKRQPGDKVKPFQYEGFLGRRRTPTAEDRAGEFTFFQYELMDQGAFWEAAGTMKAISASAAPISGFEDWRGDAGAVLVYVHGFNSSLSGAAYRTAQLTYDLEFAGVPMFFSWPANSEGNVLSYFNDVSEGAASVGDLKLFLADVKHRLKPTKYILVAHSHGNQVLLDALNEMAAEDPFAANMFDAIIFASPDVDAVEFRRLAERIENLASSKTLYTSQNDRANWFRTAITALNFNPFATPLEAKPRAGYMPDPDNPLLVRGVNTIDVTGACVGPYGSDLPSSDDNDLLKHAKYADASDLIRDMRSLIDGIQTESHLFPLPHIRNLDMQAVPAISAPRYWQFNARSDSPGCG